MIRSPKLIFCECCEERKKAVEYDLSRLAIRREFDGCMSGVQGISRTIRQGGEWVCQYCENLNDGRGAGIINDGSWTDRFNLYKDPEGKYRIECYADHSSPINYCPMCGRRLTEVK